MSTWDGFDPQIAPTRSEATRLLQANEGRELRMLAEVAGALKRVMHGHRPTWVEWDALRDAWAHCQARGIQPPE